MTNTDGGATFNRIVTAPARNNTGNVTFTDGNVTQGSTYVYRVAAENVAGLSAYVGPTTVPVDVPAAPSGVTATAVRQGNGERITATWDAVPGATGYSVQWSTSPTFATVNGSASTAGTSFTTGTISRTTWYVRVSAVNGLGSSAWSSTVSVAPAP